MIIALNNLLKYSFRILETFIAFLFFYLTISVYGSVISTGELINKGEICIYVQTNGIHTDICLPTQSKHIDWRIFISPESFPQNSTFEYITLGWGDKGFFLETPTWKELKASTALTAAFLPSETAMHVAYSEEPKTSVNRKRVFIDQQNYKRLIKYVKRSFKLKNNKVELITGKGYTKSDNFYEARNAYHLFRTCNRWTNEALKTAHVKTGIFALFPDGILSHLE